MKFNDFILKVLIIITIIIEIISLKKKKRENTEQCLAINTQCERSYDPKKNSCCLPATCVNWLYNKQIRGWGYFNEKNKVQGTCQILVRRRKMKLLK